MTMEDLDLPLEEAPEMPQPVPEELPETEPEAPCAPVSEPEPLPLYDPEPQPEPGPVPARDPEPQSAPVLAPEPEKPKKRRRKPHIALRILLQLLSFLLAWALFVTVLCGVALADLRQITSEAGIKKVVSALLNTTAEEAPVTVLPTPVQGVKLSSDGEDPDATADGTWGEIVVDGDGTVSIGDGISIDLGAIPDDILTGGGSDSNVSNLVDWLYDQVESSADADLKFSREELQDFVQESTVADYLSEKLAGFAEDFINGTDSTDFTADEIMDLLKENERLMKKKLDVELSDQQWAEVESAVEQLVEENNIGETVRTKVYDAIDSALEETTGGEFGREDLQILLQALVSDGLFYGVVAVAVALVALLCLLNYYNVPGGLTWAAMFTLLAGAVVSLPLALAQELGALYAEHALAGTLLSFLDVFKPIHYGVLILGGGLLAVSVIWRILRRVLAGR